MNRKTECLEYIKNWYVDGYVVTIMMDANNEMDDYCIQAMVVEMLKELIDYPVPDSMIEGTPTFNTFIEAAFCKVMSGLDFGFDEEQESAVKNLAWNYWVDGVQKVRNNPALKPRLYKCKRRQQTMH